MREIEPLVQALVKDDKAGLHLRESHQRFSDI